MWSWKQLSNGGSSLVTGDGKKTAIAVDLNGNVQTFNQKITDTVLTSAQILAMFATPVVIAPAPGVGFANIFWGAVLYMPYNSIVYTVPGTSELSVKYTGAAGLEVGQVEPTGFMDQASNQTRFARPHAAASANNSIAPVDNAPLVLHTLIASFTAGNSPLKIRVFHDVVPTIL